MWEDNKTLQHKLRELREQNSQLETHLEQSYADFRSVCKSKDVVIAMLEESVGFWQKARDFWKGICDERATYLAEIKKLEDSQFSEALQTIRNLRKQLHNQGICDERS